MNTIRRLFFILLAMFASIAHAQSNPFEQAAKETFSGRFTGKDEEGQEIVVRLKQVGDLWGGSVRYKGTTYDLVADQKPGQVVGTFGQEKFPFQASAHGAGLRFVAGAFSTTVQRQVLPKLEGVYESKRVKIDFQNKQSAYNGVITYNGQAFEFSAREEAGELEGIFKKGEQVFPFTVSVETHATVFKTGTLVEEMELPAVRDARLARAAAEIRQKEQAEVARRHREQELGELGQTLRQLEKDLEESTAKFAVEFIAQLCELPARPRTTIKFSRQDEYVVSYSVDRNRSKEAQAVYMVATKERFGRVEVWKAEGFEPSAFVDDCRFEEFGKSIKVTLMAKQGPNANTLRNGKNWHAFSFEALNVDAQIVRGLEQLWEVHRKIRIQLQDRIRDIRRRKDTLSSQ